MKNALALIGMATRPLVGLSSDVMAHGRGPGAEGPGRRLAALDLTAQQRQQIDQLRETAMRQSEPLRLPMAQKQDELRALWRVDQPDRSAIAQKQTEIDTLRIQQRAIWMDFRLQGHCQLLLEKLAADHPGRRGAETVLRETVRLERLSRQILEFARTGSVEPTLEDPMALARAAAEAVGAASIQVRVNGEPHPWPLDRTRMEEVLTNLLRNAIEASPDGEPVELSVSLRDDQALSYEVRDRGEGLPPGDEARIFEPFFTRKSKGTGLGLALARRIVEGHGGQLSAHNHADGGAIFRECLPRPSTPGSK